MFVPYQPQRSNRCCAVNMPHRMVGGFRHCHAKSMKKKKKKRKAEEGGDGESEAKKVKASA